MIVSQNCRGLKTNNRLDHFVAGMSKLGADVVLAQEHGLHDDDRPRLTRTCRRYGYLVFASYLPATRTHGGTMIMLKWATFGLRPSHALLHRQGLDGGVCAVALPGEGGKVFASVYVPVQPQRRSLFLRRLRRSHILTRKTIVGTDRNTVADVSVDVRHASGSHTVYPNQHAAKWDDMMAALGLRDVFRQLEGSRARMYTRLGSTVHTRIDCVFGPCKSQDYQWFSVTTRHASHASWSSDHLTLITHMKDIPPNPDIGRGPRKINPAIFNDPETRSSIAQLYWTIKDRYPPSEYGSKQVWAKQLASLSSLMRDQSADLAKAPKVDEYLEAQLNKRTKKAQSSDPDRKFAAVLKKIEKARKLARRHRPRGAQDAFRRVQFEEICTKQFHNKFKAKHERRFIGELFQVDCEGQVMEDKAGDTVSQPSDMLSQLSRYYSNLMSDKASDPAAAETLFAKLRERQLSVSDRESIEGKITRDEVLEAIAHLGLGKSPGPDGIPAEFYRAYADLLADDMTEMYNECWEDGSLTPNMLLGEIILLYKKKDPRDPRNYRPITLLNLDYKILSKILVGRLKRVIDTVISEEQTGFVPGRVITWNSHLLNLIQAYLDETDESGLFIFLDCEKAFDRVSWSFLRQAAKEIGFGPQMCRWIDTFYNDETLGGDDDAPRPFTAKRRVVCNGHRGEFFELRSGVAQGCPLSPILFLLITEGLTRLVNDDPVLQGIKVGPNTFKISQFADDTVFLLKDFSELTRMWELINLTYEPATGMKVNVTKTEGLRLGNLCDSQFDKETGSRIKLQLKLGTALSASTWVPKGWGIKWCKKGDYLISLGIPIGWDFSLKDFWRAKYLKCKALLSTWHDVERMSTYGSAMIGNSMVFSRFRYWAHCLATDKKLDAAIEQDVQALVWGKDVCFDSEEIGHQRVRRFIKEKAQYNKRRAGGIGLLHWPSHVKALTSYTLFQYCNGRSMGWKKVLDWWFGKFQEGRGAIFSTIPTKDLIASRLPGKASCLPAFYREALHHLRELHLTPTKPNRVTSREEAQGELLWTSPRLDLSWTRYPGIWRRTLGINSVTDLIDHRTGLAHSERWVCRLIRRRAKVSGQHVECRAGRDVMGFRRSTYILVSRLVNEFRLICESVGDYLLRTAASLPGETTADEGVYSKASISMMAKMGWVQGESLGKRGEGITEPVLPSGQTGKQGLGASRSSSANEASERGKQKASPIVGTELSDGQLIYGLAGERNGQLVVEERACTGRGRMYRTGRVEVACSPPREALLWDGGPVGIADSSFPHPAGWTFIGAPHGQTLEHMTMKTLTALFRQQVIERPSCEEAWPKALGKDVPIREVWGRFCSPNITPRDSKNYFRIVHRSFRTRNLVPHTNRNEESPNDEACACRLCLVEKERFSHLGKCTVISKVFSNVSSLASRYGVKVGTSPDMIYLGMIDERTVLPGALSDLHIILWKFVVIAMVKVDTEGARFKEAEVWKAAVRRLKSRVDAAQVTVERRAETALGLGHSPPPLDAECRAWEPLVYFEYDDSFQVITHYSDPYNELILDL